MPKINLKNCDVRLLIDCSGSMGADINGAYKGKPSRHAYALSLILPIAAALAPFDDDGVTLGFFNGETNPTEIAKRIMDNVKPAQIQPYFDAHQPGGGTKLAEMMKQMLTRCEIAMGEKNQLIIVGWDGAPQDRDELAQVIVAHTKKMKSDGQTAILFIKFADDAGTADFETFLDDQLVDKLGAAFDIVDCKSDEYLQTHALTADGQPNLEGIQEVVDEAFNETSTATA